jgi:ORF6N domain
VATRTGLVPLERITRAILVLRGQRVILDRELAAIYGVTTKRLNEQVKRNAERFPEDFMFQLTAEEAELSRSQIATLKAGRGQNIKYRPYAFTEHGAIQAANVLSSPRAIAMGVYVVRAFVQLREILASNKDLARKLTALERSLVALDLKTQRQFKEVYEAIRALMNPPPAKRRGIGFTADLEETP